MPDTTSAAAFHERTKLPPDDGYHQRDRANRPRDHKAYVDLPTQALADRIRPPQVPTLAALSYGDSRPEDPATRSAIDLDTLTQLCYFAAGVTAVNELENRTIRFRAASCTGALYHIDLYPVVGEDGPVPAGVYHFDPLSCSLDVLREGDFRGVLAEATGQHDRVADAPVTFVTTSTWWRNAWKYTERTYRHAFWDSGTVLANLLTVAHAQDLPAAAVLGFADQPVADLLGVDIDDEAPLELVPVGADSPAPEARDVPDISPETEPLSPNPIEFPLIAEAYRGSMLDDGDAVREWRATAGKPGDGAGRESAPEAGERVPLDPVGDDRASKAPLPVSIRRRRSCREYAPDPLNFRKFSTVLDRAIRSLPLDATPGDDPLALLDCYLIVNAVEGLDSGSYQYHPEDGELELLRRGEFRDDARRLALGQDWAGDAAVGVYFVADVEAVVDRLGDRGYRAAQLEAGLLGGRFYLATYAHRDLAGLGLTFRDDDVTEFFAPRAAGTTPMFHYVFGRPA